MTCRWCGPVCGDHGDGSCACPECKTIRERDLSDNETLDQAINTVALRVAANLAEDCGDEWGNYPEIGESDWLAVQDRVAFIAGQLTPGHGDFIEAYDLLEQRAIGVEA